MLAHTWHKTTGIPVVFLHGLLGSQQDWQRVVQHLQNMPRIRPLTLDLPYHSNSTKVKCADFNEVRATLHHTLNGLIGNQPFYLVGYSLGGRIALDYTLNANNPNLLHTFLEGTNIGLQTQVEKRARLKNDQHWAKRFRTESIQKVLADWYQQPVFANLSANKRSDLIQKRQVNNGTAIAEMLEATSLAKQPYFSSEQCQTKPMTFLIGEQDRKFRQQAEQHSLPYQLIPNAGHNAHYENAQEFSDKLCRLIMP